MSAAPRPPADDDVRCAHAHALRLAAAERARGVELFRSAQYDAALHVFCLAEHDLRCAIPIPAAAAAAAAAAARSDEPPCTEHISVIAALRLNAAMCAIKLGDHESALSELDDFDALARCFDASVVTAAQRRVAAYRRCMALELRGPEASDLLRRVARQALMDHDCVSGGGDFAGYLRRMAGLAPDPRDSPQHFAHAMRGLAGNLGSSLGCAIAQPPPLDVDAWVSANFSPQAFCGEAASTFTPRLMYPLPRLLNYLHISRHVSARIRDTAAGKMSLETRYLMHLRILEALADARAARIRFINVAQRRFVETQGAAGGGGLSGLIRDVGIDNLAISFAPDETRHTDLRGQIVSGQNPGLAARLFPTLHANTAPTGALRRDQLTAFFDAEVADDTAGDASSSSSRRRRRRRRHRLLCNLTRIFPSVSAYTMAAIINQLISGHPLLRDIYAAFDRVEDRRYAAEHLLVTEMAQQQVLQVSVYGLKACAVPKVWISLQDG